MHVIEQLEIEAGCAVQIVEDDDHGPARGLPRELVGDGGERRPALAGAAMCARASRVEYEGIARMLLGEAQRGRGDLAAATVELASAVELLRRLDLNTRWRAELDLAHVLAAQGQDERARPHAHSARDQLQWQRAHLAPGTATTALDLALVDVDALLATLAEP